MVVRKVSDSIDISIREKLSDDPNAEDWERALKTVNAFYRKLRVAKAKEE